MNESKRITAWTPGPWKIVPTNQGTYIEGNVEKPIGYLCQIRAVHPDGNRIMEEANARLIAAAPELYEALKAMDEAYPQADSPQQQEACELMVNALALVEKETT